jgi:hypothetical protein
LPKKKEKLFYFLIFIHIRITALPEGLTNYQLKQWSESFNELKERMINFGFKDDVLTISNIYFIEF